MVSGKSETERAKCRFTVKEYGSGTPWIMLELNSPGIKSIGDGFLGFDLLKGTSMARAQEIASLLSDNVAEVGLTTFK